MQMDASNSKPSKWHLISGVLVPLCPLCWIIAGFFYRPIFPDVGLNYIVEIIALPFVIVGLINLKCWRLLQNPTPDIKTDSLLQFSVGLSRCVAFTCAIILGGLIIAISLYVTSFPSYSSAPPVYSTGTKITKAFVLFVIFAIIFALIIALPALLAFSTHRLSNPIRTNDTNYYYLFGKVAGIAVLVISAVIYAQFV